MSIRHTLSIIVADQPGELSRIVGLFSARGFNIETISVGETLDPRWSRVTIVTRGEDRTIQQIVKQCERLARVRELNKPSTTYVGTSKRSVRTPVPPFPLILTF